MYNFTKHVKIHNENFRVNFWKNYYRRNNFFFIILSVSPLFHIWILKKFQFVSPLLYTRKLSLFIKELSDTFVSKISFTENVVNFCFLRYIFVIVIF
jgi:hypothetical protein